MKRLQSILALLFICLWMAAPAEAQRITLSPKPLNQMDTISAENIPGPVVEIATNLGNIKIKLFNDTPLHRDNFLKLVKDGFYEGLLFHRVINNFMVQAGDPESRNAVAGERLGAGNPGYTVEAEILPTHSHRYGALAAARTADFVNPERRSSGSQFYIVSNKNGTPHLDGAYTVFGQVIEGMDTIEKIQNVETDRYDRPVDDVEILSIKVVED